MFEDFNNYDFFVIGFLLITTAIGFIRGFSGELCSLIKIIFASFISAYTVVTLKDTFFGGESGIVSNVVLSVVPGTVFFVVNIVLSMVLFPVKEAIRALIPFLLDRILGVFLAGVKNLLVIILIHILLTVGFDSIFGKEIKWVQDAELSGFLDEGADVVLETGLIQMFFAEKFGGSSSKSSSDESSSSSSSVKNIFDSFLGDKGDSDDGGSSNYSDTTVDKVTDKSSDSEDSLLDKINVFKNIYDSLGDDEKEAVKDQAIEKASDIDTDQLKDLIDGLKN
jgi:uncharacterized membrane protein required for colicin V production